MAGILGRMKCSWCGVHYGCRYGYDGKNIFMLTWDFLTFFWFWWHPHFCSDRCKLAYKERKGETGIQRDISGIKSAISFLKGDKSSDAGKSNNVTPQDETPQEQRITENVSQPNVSYNQDETSNNKPKENFQSATRELNNIDEFKRIIQVFIDTNGEQIFCKRIHWKSFPEKILTNATNRLKIPNGESIMMIIDGSLTGSGKEGMALTDWGIRYNDGVDSWNLTWSDLQEKYSLNKIIVDGALGVKGDALLLQVKPGDEFVVNRTISLSMASIDYDLLARVLNKTCLIFTGVPV